MRELSLINCRLDKRYDVYERLGCGSYAEVFAARDTLASPKSPHSTVVIKALNVFLQEDLDADLERTLVENFQNEAIALDRVRHPNIISRLGHGTARDLEGTMFHYLVLEFMAGGDLQKVARKPGSLPLETAFRYIEQACAGLAHAHEKGIIHRDVKPHNLLLSGDAEIVKIADFGVARVLHADSPITRVGTNIYAPPEHSPLTSPQDVALYSQRLTPASDIYSLAKTVYAILTGESPRYCANSPITELPLGTREKPWADALRNALHAATQNDPEKRPQSVEQFWRDLEPVRRAAFPGARSAAAVGSASIPRSSVSKGYSPTAPIRPRFDTSKDLHLKHPYVPRPLNYDRPADFAAPSDSDTQAAETRAPEPTAGAVIFAEPATPLKPRKRSRAAALIVAAFLFAAALYGTSAYWSGLKILPGMAGTSLEKTGRANTDINLRPAPTVANDPIGLVTQNSKLRILKSQNNWLQVDVLEQGRPGEDQIAASRGWLNGKYVDMDQ